MKELQKINTREFYCAPFDLIGNQWMLITAKKDEIVNTMTASWGGLGVIWNKNVAYIFVRQSRYTKEFIDGSDSFSLSFFDPDQYRKTLAYLGNVSGREEDKIQKSGLTVVYEEEIPYFQEAQRVLLCSKLSRHFLGAEGFMKDGIDSQMYHDGDYHDLYIGEVLHILER